MSWGEAAGEVAARAAPRMGQTTAQHVAMFGCGACGFALGTLILPGQGTTTVQVLFELAPVVLMS